MKHLIKAFFIPLTLLPLFLSSCQKDDRIEVTINHFDGVETVKIEDGKVAKIDPHYVRGKILKGYYDKQSGGNLIIRADGYSNKVWNEEMPKALYAQFMEESGVTLHPTFQYRSKAIDVLELSGRGKNFYVDAQLGYEYQVHFNVFQELNVHGTIRFDHYEESHVFSNWVNYSVSLGDFYQSGKLENKTGYITESFSYSTKSKSVKNGIEIKFYIPDGNFSPDPARFKNFYLEVIIG